MSEWPTCGGNFMSRETFNCLFYSVIVLRVIMLASSKKFNILYYLFVLPNHVNLIAN